MNTNLRNTFRRLRLAKAKPQPQSDGNVGVGEDKGYHCHFDDDDFAQKTLSDTNDADVVWESLSSLTLKDNSLQSSSGRLSSSPFMILDASSNPIPSNSPLIDTIVKGTTDATLLSIAEHVPGLLGQRGAHGRYPVHLPAPLLRHLTSSTSVSACVLTLLQLRMTMVELRFTFCANLMQNNVMHPWHVTSIPSRSA